MRCIKGVLVGPDLVFDVSDVLFQDPAYYDQGCHSKGPSDHHDHDHGLDHDLVVGMYTWPQCLTYVTLHQTLNQNQNDTGPSSSSWHAFAPPDLVSLNINVKMIEPVISNSNSIFISNWIIEYKNMSQRIFYRFDV